MDVEMLKLIIDNYESRMRETREEIHQLQFRIHELSLINLCERRGEHVYHSDIMGARVCKFCGSPE